jgi:hypothetical protein
VRQRHRQHVQGGAARSALAVMCPWGPTLVLMTRIAISRAAAWTRSRVRLMKETCRMAQACTSSEQLPQVLSCRCSEDCAAGSAVGQRISPRHQPRRGSQGTRAAPRAARAPVTRAAPAARTLCPARCPLQQQGHIVRCWPCRPFVTGVALRLGLGSSRLSRHMWAHIHG